MKGYVFFYGKKVKNAFIIPSLKLEKEYGFFSSTVRKWKYKANHEKLIKVYKKEYKSKN